MKHGSTTSLKNQIGSQLNGQQQVKAIQSNQTQTSTGKVLASVFWDVQGILFINYLANGRNINNEYYIALLVHLKEEIAKKQPQMKKKNVLFHQDNALCHKSITMMMHPLYSPDLAPSN